MRVVVTGARGYIGSVLTKRLSEIGWDVIALDDGSRGLNDIAALDRSHRNGSHVDYFQHDCQGGFGEILATLHSLYGSPIHVDAVVHLAAGTGSLDRPYEELVALNVEMTKRIYHDALSFGAKLFAFPTTSLGTADELADSPYVKSKEDAMNWLQNAARPKSLQLLPLRFFNVAGAYKGFTERRQREVHLIPRIAECIKRHETLTINGSDYDTLDGSPSREFVNVVDVATFIEYQIVEAVAAGVLIGTPHPQDHCYWLSPGQSLSVRRIVRLVDRFFDSHLVTIDGPRRAYDVGQLYCDSAQVKQFSAIVGGATPPWVSIRDEIAALLG